MDKLFRKGLLTFSLAIGFSGLQPTALADTTLTFDEFPDNTPLGNQYQALGLTVEGAPPVIRDASLPLYDGAALGIFSVKSRPNYVYTGGTPRFYFNTAITGPIYKVSTYVSAPGAGARLAAMDASGKQIAYSELTPAQTTLSRTEMVQLTVTSATPIAWVSLFGNYYGYVFDNFTFGGTPPYTFSGFSQPVDAYPTLNTAKAGGAIPVRFSLGGDKGLGILAQGSPTSAQVNNCSVTAGTDAIEELVTASNSGLTYDASTGQYTYVWKTNKTWGGTCRQLTIRFSDGSEQKALFQFTR